MTRLPVQSGLRRLATACIHYARQPRSSLTPSTAPARPAAPTLAQLDFEQLESRRPVRLQPAAATSRSALVAQPPIPDSLVRTTPAGGGEAPLSNRKKFQAVQPLPSVMGYLAARQMGKGRVRSTRDKYGPQLYPAAHQLLMPQYTSLKSRMKLIVAAQNPSQFPDRTVNLEVCVAGRSNVGKSTLLNMLGISKIVVADDRPGTTRTLDFFQLKLPGNAELTLVDMPGYGFAFAKPEDRAQWDATMRAYLQQRSQLRTVLLLLDARHGIKQVDREFMTFLEQNACCQYQLILTKCDLVPREDLARRWQLIKAEIAERWRRCRSEVLVVSKASPFGAGDIVHMLLKLTGRKVELRRGSSVAAGEPSKAPEETGDKKSKKHQKLCEEEDGSRGKNQGIARRDQRKTAAKTLPARSAAAGKRSGTAAKTSGRGKNQQAADSKGDKSNGAARWQTAAARAMSAKSSAPVKRSPAARSRRIASRA